MKRLLDTLGRMGTAALSLVMLAMVVLLCVNVALRYIWGASLLWADEAMVSAMVVTVFLAGVGVSRRDQHLRMSLITQSLPPSVQRTISAIEQVVTIGVCLFVAWYSFRATILLYRRGTVSNMAEIPLWLIYIAVLAGLVGIALVALGQLGSIFNRRGK